MCERIGEDDPQLRGPRSLLTCYTQAPCRRSGRLRRLRAEVRPACFSLPQRVCSIASPRRI
jgi:hypothetical protein